VVSDLVLRGVQGAVPITPKLLRQLKRWDADGVPRREMSRRTGVSLRRIMLVLGKKPPRQLGNPRPVWNVYCHTKPWLKAVTIAKSLGYRTTAGPTAGVGSVGAMVEAIGNGELVVMTAEEARTLRYDSESYKIHVQELLGDLGMMHGLPPHE